MKILHSITTINRGGAENHLVELVKGQTHSHEVTVAFLKGDRYWQQTLEAMGVKTVDLRMKFYGDIQPFWQLRSLINQFTPDIVHAHLPPAELYTALALTGMRSIPLVISKHNDEPFYKIVGQQLIARQIAKRADHIIAISQSVKNNVCFRDLACSPSKVSTVYYGIDQQPYKSVSAQSVQQLHQQWAIDEGTYLIGTVARLVPQKSLHTLLKGFQLYLQKTSVQTKLVIVGQGSLEAELKQQATALGIEQFVVWAGYHEDIPAVMTSLDLLALTSEYEGFGHVLLEAMAAQKPVVASEVSAIPEVVKNGISGVLVPPQQPDQLAEVFAFFEHVEKRDLFGKNGRQTVQQNFTLSAMIAKTQQAYEQAIAYSKHKQQL
ncbi:MAG: glycosyltransferase [Phormidesmis sp.]